MPNILIMKIRTYILIGFLSLISLSIIGQSKSAFKEAADSAFMDQDYYSAMVYYSTVLEFTPDETEILYKYGESAMEFDAYNLADSLFRKVYEQDQGRTYPLTTFYIADMKQRQGDYDAASEYYRLFVSLSDSESEFHLTKANKEIEACDWALTQIASKDPLTAINRIEGNVNTEYSEFAASEIGDSLFFSSLRFQDDDGPYDPDRLLSKILLKDADGNVAKIENDVNTTHRITAHSSFNEEHKIVFFTVCGYNTASELRCDLYYAPFDEDYNITGPGEKLPDHINDSRFTQTQPHSYQDRLYFVSDREDGLGGYDIWMSEFNPQNMHFTLPTNLESVNTSSDEITPFYHDKSSKFYFSSNGYIGFGGYDIYETDLEEESKSAVKNLGSPFNSSYHDLYYSVSESGNLYLSSNRAGSMYIESSSEACCYDIYNIELANLKLKLNAQSYHAITLDSLPSVYVTLVDDETGDEQLSIINNEGIDHVFDIKFNKNYRVIAKKDGYEDDEISFSTIGVTTSEDIIKKLFLRPSELNLNLTVFDKISLDELKGATVTIRDMSGKDKDVIFSNPDENSFSIPLLRGKSYQIIIQKEGYESNSFEINTDDYTDQTEINKKIYLKPRDILDVYLPLSLYFDNDYPNPRSWSRKTKKTYSQTYFPYVNKEEYFKSEFSKGMNDNQSADAHDAISNFFENDLRQGFTKLNEFLDALYGRLYEGETITIQIKGHASPKYTSKYNKRLSVRRIASVLNELKKYKSGLLKGFIDSGKLVVEEAPFGEDLAPFNVSDSATDKKFSVFSPEASKERRAEIVKVNSNRSIK